MRGESYEKRSLRFLKDPKTSKEVRNLAFAYFSPDEFPTHRMLQELMMLEPLGMITIERRSDIKIPAFSGSLRYEYARPLGASRPMDAQ